MKSIFDRRDFLKATGVTLAASSNVLSWFPSHAFAATASTPQPKSPPAPSKIRMPPMKGANESESDDQGLSLPWEEKVGFAIIGLGRIALEQAMPAITQSKRAKVVALVSSSPDKAQKVAHAYNVKKENIYNYENLNEISKNPEIKAVYVATPNSTHRDFTVRSAQAGKHVLCEKPISASLSDGEEMISACKKANVKLMIAYRQQYEPYNTIIQQMIKNKTYGKPHLYQAHFGQLMGDPSQWRLKKALAGGGPLPDMGIYCLNACRFHTGLEPIEVFGQLQENHSDSRFKEVEEGVVWQMRFADGMIAHCSTSYAVHQSGSFRYYGDRGWFGLSPAFTYQGMKLELAYGEEAINYMQTPYVDEKNQFVLEFEHFCEAVLENKTIQSPGEEGLKDLRIIEAIYASAKEGRPVHINKF